MSDKYKKLYEAQKAEHEKTWKKLRKANLQIKHLQGEVDTLAAKLGLLRGYIRGLCHDIAGYL